jgi:flagellar hook-associated protein 3 FlgL
MRITEQTRASLLVQGLDQYSTTLNTLSQELATGKKVNQPSDDPVATGAIIRTNTYIADLNENLSVINSAQSFSQSASTVMSTSSSTLSEVQTLATQACNGTESASDLQALGTQVNQYLESLVQDANSQFDGSYLFSGTKTDTAPIAVTRDAQGNIQGITYQGSDTDLTYPVSQDRSSAVSVTAQAAYMNVLAAVKQLRDDLDNTQGLSSADQQAALSNDLSAINAAQSSFTAQAAEVGTYQSQLTALSSQMQNSLTNAQSILSNYQDADMAQISVQLQSAQTQYQAIVASGAQQMQQPDLFSYLTG